MEKSTIQERHDQLDQEILSFAKNENYALMKQKVDLQKKLSQILEKGKQEEMVFDEKNLLDDQLYVKAKEVGDQKLLDKFHNRSLTRKEYVKACKDLNINLGIDAYYSFLDKYDKIFDCNKYGLAVVQLDNKYGVINQESQEEIVKCSDCIYIGEFDEYGIASVTLRFFGLVQKRYINTQGEKFQKHPFTKKKG